LPCKYAAFTVEPAIFLYAAALFFGINRGIMQVEVVSEAVDLWEAWVDLGTGGFVLYVVGDTCTGTSKTAPVLVKKTVQGADKSHLILELVSFGSRHHGRLAEVRYTEIVDDIDQYSQVSICAGEEIIIRIPDIEVVY
jgi:glycine cleavage system regulatory protein